MKSNCFLSAWGHYLKNEEVWVCFRRSKHSRLRGKIPRIVKAAALILLYPVFAMYGVLHTIAFETWPHFVWAERPVCRSREFVPTISKKTEIIPPVLFSGTEKQIVDLSCPFFRSIEDQT